MKPHEILNLRRIKFIMFPYVDNGNLYSDTSNLYDEFVKNREVIKLKCYGNSDTYYMSPEDEHHFTTAWHYNYLMPLLAKEFDFNYSKNDFDLIPYTVDFPKGTADYSYFLPKENTDYEVFSPIIQRGENCTISMIYNSFNANYKDLVLQPSIYNWDYFKAFSDNTKLMSIYRRLYYFPHQVSKLTNLNSTSDRTLLIFGDSQMIPSVLPLSIYFKKTIYMNCREYINTSFMYDDENVTDILFAFWGSTHPSMFLERDFWE